MATIEQISDLFEVMLDAKLQGINDKLDHNIRNWEDLNKKQIILENVTSGLMNEVNDLRSTVNDLKQDQLSNKLVIRGIPDVEDSVSQLQDMVWQVFNLMKLSKVQLGDIKVLRLGKQKQEVDPTEISSRPIEVILANQEIRDKIIEARALMRKEKGVIDASQIQIGECVAGDETDLVYVDEKMTQEKAIIFSTARKKLLKEGLFKFVWFKRGDVWCKNEEIKSLKKIRSLHDVEKLASEATALKKAHKDLQPKAQAPPSVELSTQAKEIQKKPSSTQRMVYKRKAKPEVVQPSKFQKNNVEEMQS